MSSARRVATAGSLVTIVLATSLTCASSARGVVTGATAATWRSTARYEKIVDANGVLWQGRTGWTGNMGRSTSLVGKDISGTTNDILYQINAFGITGYSQAVTSPGEYRVTLKMAEDYHTLAGKRVFDVTAEGRAVVTGVDIAKAVGRGAAHDVSFTTAVTDGTVNLGFVARMDKPLVSAIEVTQIGEVSGAVATAPDAASTAPHAIEFAPSSFYYQDISTAPLAADSAQLTTLLAAQVSSRWGGVAAFNAYHYNTSLYRVDSTVPKTNVNFWDCQNKGYTPVNLVDGMGQFLNVPIPATAVPALGSDGTMTIYDPAADKVWEFWQMRRNPTSQKWEACWGGRLDKVSTAAGHFSGNYGSTATGLVMGGGVITMDDVRRGYINHALQISVTDAAKGVFSWPAQRTDGLSTAPVALTEGQRLRLDPSLDVSTLGLTPVGQMVAKAAQKYGFIIADKGGAVAVKTESGLAAKASTGVNPWDTLLGGVPESKVMTNFPWHRMQFVPKDYGKP